MINIEQLVSPLVKSQFPEFYNEEGARFIDFVKQYYVWLESQNQTLNVSRNLFNIRDIDHTNETFINHFKQKYLRGIPLTSSSNTRLLTKHSLDFYKSKGTQNTVELVIRGLFNEEASVYYPGDDIFKSSHGVWVKPVYLELTVSERTRAFVGQEVVGSTTGAKAFVEGLVKRRIQGRYIDIAYLSDVRGTFNTGEQVTASANTNLTDAPSVTGSLTDLSVVAGGADFSVGDIFDIESSTGKQGQARVTSISNETGKVNFIYIDAMTSGGWGYSLAHSNAMISSKVLVLSNVTNSNTSITNFTTFDTVTQNIANLAYSTARPNNANYAIGAVVENYYSNGDVAANGTVIAINTTSNTAGYILISPNVGNVASLDTTFAIRGNGTNAAFNANSGVANATDIITTTASHGFVNNDIVLYKLLTGNTVLSGLSSGAAYYVVNANATTLQLSDTLGGVALNVTAGLNQSGHVLLKSGGSGVITAYVDRTATGNVIGSNSTSVGVVDITGGGFVATPYNKIVGSLSNTTATINSISTGTGADFNIGLLTDTENVFLSPDFLHSNNTQNVVFSTINLNGNNSGAALQYGVPLTLSTSDTSYGGFGFIKYPGSNMDSVLLDCLRFDATIIGAIATITGLNPGNDYNQDPYVLVYDSYVAGYDKRDYIMTVTPGIGTFVEGEMVQQTYSTPAVQLTVNTFSGTAANGTATSTVLAGEFVYQSNGTANVAASGFVIESAISAGAGSIKLGNVTGTFVVTSNTTLIMKSLTTGGTANISAASLTTQSTTARARVKDGSSYTQLYLKRLNLENTFQTGSYIIGQTSGATAVVDVVAQDAAAIPIGMNANIVANVQTANAVVSGLALFDSGFGYIDKETVTLTKVGSPYVVTAITSISKEGRGAGYYTSTRGFLDADKRLEDNDFYQEYSYQVESKIPFDRYIDVLKKITHVAGTKAFGKVVSASIVNTNMTAINSIVIT